MLTNHVKQRLKSGTPCFGSPADVGMVNDQRFLAGAARAARGGVRTEP